MRAYEESLDTAVDLIVRFMGKDRVKTIIELGARDCNETVEFARRFPAAMIFTFECNPTTIPLCRQRVKQERNIKLIEKAVTDRNGTIAFFPTNREKTTTTWEDGNPGASSVYRATGKYPVEKYVQDEIVVQSITLKTFLEEARVGSIDLLWMDIQGAELMALKGLSEAIKNVKFIHAEVEFLEIYERQPLFEDVKRYLNSQGFLFLGHTNGNEYFADAVFVNSRFIRSTKERVLLKLLDTTLPYASMKVHAYITKRIKCTL